MSQNFFRDLEPWRKRHQPRRDWRGEKGRERKKFKSLDQRCKMMKMFPLNLRER
jgi:hypothetical protein